MIREQDRDVVSRALEREVGPPDVEVVVGGDTRHGSEWEALQVLAPAIEAGDVDVVVIHDAARPLAGSDMWADVIDVASRPAGPSPPTTTATSPRSTAAAPPDRVVAVQTPQAFLARPLLDAYRKAHEDGFVGTDTASCIEQYAVAGALRRRRPGQHQDHLPRRPLHRRAAARARPVGPVGRTRDDGEHRGGEATMSTELAELHCETCDRVTEHELQYTGRLLDRSGARSAEHTSTSPAQQMLPSYLADLEQRVASKPARMLRRAVKDPTGFAKGLPGAVARQPAKIVRELRSIFRH